MMLGVELPDLDGKKTRNVVESAFEKYRFYKYVTFNEREASLTPNYELKEGVGSGTVSDQTASIAVYNVDTPEMRKEYCSRIERFVDRLPGRERTLIKERYMVNDERVTDQHIYNVVLLCSDFTFRSLRSSAMYKLAFMLHDFRMIRIEDIAK